MLQRIDLRSGLGDHLACQGIQKVTLESTSDYWRIWFYLLEAVAWMCSWSTPVT